MMTPPERQVVRGSAQVVGADRMIEGILRRISANANPTIASSDLVLGVFDVTVDRLRSSFGNLDVGSSRQDNYRGQFPRESSCAAVVRYSLWPVTRGCCPASASGRFGHRLAAAPGLRTPQTRGYVRARKDHRTGAAAQGTVPVDHHAVGAAGGAGDRRGVAAQRQDRLRTRRRPAW
jgi:hypothetical protein